MRHDSLLALSRSPAVHGLNEHILDLGHASGAGNAIRNGMAVFEIEAASADERGITEAICR